MPPIPQPALHSLGEQAVQLAQSVTVAFVGFGGVEQGGDAVAVELSLVAAAE